MYHFTRLRAAIWTLVIILSVPCGVLAADFNKQTFTPWDVDAASKQVAKHEKKPYTVMVYMNGSDLESEGGAATNDLIEMLDAGLDARNAHVVIFTGGANRWQNNVVPANDCVIWEIVDGWLYELTGVGQVNMGDPGTLSSFIQFGLKNFPADKYGLIMWDHGGGAIAGYGQDEKFVNGNLTLMDMQNAFAQAGLAEQKLEFLGFDSCLMATVEMAVVASDYARYLIASEDLEPGDGWDYSFLSVFNRTPEADGKVIGVAVVDAFISYYGGDTDEILSLSVTDLSKAGQVMRAMGKLMAPCSDDLLKNKTTSFRTLAGKRNRTKTFGEGSPRDNECDMVDIGDMALKLRDLYPTEAAEVLGALENCVIYNRHNSDISLKGLSTYYIYGGKAVGRPALNTYTSLSMNEDYTQYLHHFFNALTGSTATSSRTRNRTNAESTEMNTDTEAYTEAALVLWEPVTGRDGSYRMLGLCSDMDTPADKQLWPQLNGKPVCMYPVNRSLNNDLYAIPVQINGRDGDIIVLVNDRYPEGMIKGVRNNEGIIIQKGCDPIHPGDRIALYYMEHTFNKSSDWLQKNNNGNQSDDKSFDWLQKNNNGSQSDDKEGDADKWHKSPAFTVSNDLQLTWSPAGKSCVFGLRLTDIRNDIHYTQPMSSRKAA